MYDVNVYDKRMQGYNSGVFLLVFFAHIRYDKDTMSEVFPKDFLWGAATSSHQVEGGNRNDWSEWEAANADRLAHEAEKRFGHLPSWPMIKEQATKPENYISGSACDHYHRFREDFDIAKSLGHNAHRFSIEWSRIEPEEGKFDEKEIEHYGDVIRALRDRGMEPFVTLWHWTLPVWLRDKGGVHASRFPYYFQRYAEKVAHSFKHEIRFWITVNEPEIYALNAYARGVWPPQKRGMINFFRTTYALNLAHQEAYRVLKGINADFEIGASLNMAHFESAAGLVNNILKWCADRVWNRRFLWHIQRELDFIGLNHYFHNRINYGFNRNENKHTSDMGWELYPEAIYHVLHDLKKYNKPIYITENGLADAGDKNRAWFIQETLKQVSLAMREGVEVHGYFHWSLLDNFEWDKGFWPRFGLVEIDYKNKTLERKIRPSAWEYKKIIDSSKY